MLFRFVAALTLVTAVSLLGISLEKQNLALKRTISLQHYRLEILEEKRSRLILKTHQLGAIPRLAAASEEPLGNTLVSPDEPAPPKHPPLLEWRLRGER